MTYVKVNYTSTRNVFYYIIHRIHVSRAQKRDVTADIMSMGPFTAAFIKYLLVVVWFYYDSEVSTLV